MSLQNIKIAYFIGIGGIGMSALARYFRALGVFVAGYDRTSTVLTRNLVREGIPVHYTDSPELLPEGMNTSNSIVVFTPAVPDDFGEMKILRERGFDLVKRAKVLGIICNDRNCIAVAGTHGKTTVSTMAATILYDSKAGCSAILGGISKNFNSNLLLPAEDKQWVVTEADEYDRSFLNLTPDIALITSMDADHLDIYGNIGELRKSFGEFAMNVKAGGKVIRKLIPETQALSNPDARFFTYSIVDESADFSVRNLVMGEGPVFSTFSLHTPIGLIPDIRMSYPGYLNVENAAGAAAISLLAGATPDEVRNGLWKYQGVKRRFDLQYAGNNRLYFDDYAHHPEELKAFILSVRKQYPGRKITGIFQPHLFSRTLDFSGEFASSLDLLDTAIVLPIYPARELPVPGVTSQIITDRMQSGEKFLLSKDDALTFVADHDIGILLTMGAGDIENMAAEFVEIMKGKGVCSGK